MDNYTGKNSYFRIIEGDCFGLGLSVRDEESRVILYTILHEDDGSYFESSFGWSSFWLNKHTSFMEEAYMTLQKDYPINKHGEFYLPKNFRV